MNYKSKIYSIFFEQFPSFKGLLETNQNIQFVSFEYVEESFGNFTYIFKFKKLYFSILMDRGDYYLLFSIDRRSWFDFQHIYNHMKNTSGGYINTIDGVLNAGPLLNDALFKNITEILSNKEKFKAFNDFLNKENNF